MEMLEGEPPYLDYDPDVAIEMIRKNGVPELQDENKWSSELRDFRMSLLNPDPDLRPSATFMLADVFLEKRHGPEDIAALIKRSRAAMVQHHIALNDSTRLRNSSIQRDRKVSVSGHAMLITSLKH